MVSTITNSKNLQHNIFFIINVLALIVALAFNLDFITSLIIFLINFLILFTLVIIKIIFSSNFVVYDRTNKKIIHYSPSIYKLIIKLFNLMLSTFTLFFMLAIFFVSLLFYANLFNFSLENFQLLNKIKVVNMFNIFYLFLTLFMFIVLIIKEIYFLFFYPNKYKSKNFYINFTWLQQLLNLKIFYFLALVIPTIFIGLLAHVLYPMLTNKTMMFGFWAINVLLSRVEFLTPQNSYISSNNIYKK